MSVTDVVSNLQLALRLCGYNMDIKLLNLTWKLLKLIEKKGNLATIKDITDIEIYVFGSIEESKTPEEQIKEEV